MVPLPVPIGSYLGTGTGTTYRTVIICLTGISTVLPPKKINSKINFRYLRYLDYRKHEQPKSLKDWQLISTTCLCEWELTELNPGSQKINTPERNSRKENTDSEWGLKKWSGNQESFLNFPWHRKCNLPNFLFIPYGRYGTGTSR